MRVKKTKMTKLLAMLLSLVMLLTFVPSMTGYSKDTNGHWAESQIAQWQSKGLVSGYPDGTFRPEANITRAELITLVNRVFSYQAKANLAYTDIKKEDWFYDEIAKGVAAGYLSGYTDGTVRAQNNITRQEAAVVVAKAFALFEKNSVSSNSFADAKQIATWSANAVGVLADKSVIRGYPDASFKPENNIKRSEAIALLHNASGDIYNTVATYKENAKGNVVVSKDGVTLKDMSIEGDLYLAEGIGEGNVLLDGVTVKGVTYVRAGGQNSVVFKNSKLSNVVINKANATQPVRVVAEGNTSVSGTVSVHTGAKLESINVPEQFVSFTNVELTNKINSNAVVQLAGNIANVTISSTNKVEIQSKSITNLIIQSAATVSITKGSNIGKVNVANTAAGAKIDSAIVLSLEVNANNVKVNNTNVDAGSKISVSENGTVSPVTNDTGTQTKDETKNVAEQKPVSPTNTVSSGGGGGGGSSGGGGGDSGGGNSSVPVTGVSVDQATLNQYAGGATGTITATVSPSNATNKNVTWSSNNEAVATVNNGVVTPVAAGTATITATTVDGSITATTAVTVTATPTVTTAAELQAALNASGVTAVTLGGNISGNVTVTRTGTTNVTLNFGAHTLSGNLSFTANNVEQITLNGNDGNRIIGNLIITAPLATVNNNVAISGSATLNGVGFSSYNATETHGQGISMAGKGRLNLSGGASSANVAVSTTEPVALAGTITGNVTVTTSGANAIVQGSVSNIIVDNNATGTTIQAASGSNLGAVEANANITLAKESGVTDPVTTGTGVITTKTSYKVTFNNNNGSTEADPTFMLAVAGSSLGTLPTAPSKTGHTFAGWNTAANGTGTTFNAATTVTGILTVYAQWTINTYTVTFNKNTGTTDASPTTKTATHGGNVGTLPTAPSKTGYIFTSWNTAANGSGTSFTATSAVTANTTVYAQWISNTLASAILVRSAHTDGRPTSEVSVTIDGDIQDSFELYFDNSLLASTTNGKVVVATASVQNKDRLKVIVNSVTYQGSTLSF